MLLILDYARDRECPIARCADSRANWPQSVHPRLWALPRRATGTTLTAFSKGTWASPRVSRLTRCWRSEASLDMTLFFLSILRKWPLAGCGGKGSHGGQMKVGSERFVLKHVAHIDAEELQDHGEQSHNRDADQQCTQQAPEHAHSLEESLLSSQSQKPKDRFTIAILHCSGARPLTFRERSRLHCPAPSAGPQRSP